MGRRFFKNVKGQQMSIEIGQKYINEKGEVVEVLDIINYRTRKGEYDFPTVIYIGERVHVLTWKDFAEQYNHYEIIYEYMYAIQLYREKIIVTYDFYKDDEEFAKEWLSENDKSAYQRIDFTKRERKCTH